MLSVFKFIKNIAFIYLMGIMALHASTNNAVWKVDRMNDKMGDALYETLSSIFTANDILPQGEIGISAINLKTGQMFSLNGDKPFFMASTYKVAIATQLLRLVDQKVMKLDQLETITPHDMVPGSGIITRYFKDTTITLPLNTLLQLMLQESDNTATDRVLKLAGGPKAVTQYLRQLGITDMSVNRSTLEFTRDYFNVELPPYNKRNIQTLMAIYEKATPNLAKFLSDKRDSSTPNAMIKLLGLIDQHHALSASSTKILLHIMSNRDDNTGRLFYYLPNVTVAQKLGTAESVANDVGLITLPSDAGTIAIAIFSKHIPSNQVINNKIPALIAKTIYDFFLFNTNSNIK